MPGGYYLFCLFVLFLCIWVGWVENDASCGTAVKHNQINCKATCYFLKFVIWPTTKRLQLICSLIMCRCTYNYFFFFLESMLGMKVKWTFVHLSFLFRFPCFLTKSRFIQETELNRGSSEYQNDLSKSLTWGNGSVLLRKVQTKALCVPENPHVPSVRTRTWRRVRCAWPQWPDSF